MKLQILILLISQLLQAESARILSVIPTASRSHYQAGRSILLELVRRGHEVVSISPFEEKGVANFTTVKLDALDFLAHHTELQRDMNEKLSFFGSQRRLWRYTRLFADYITKLPNLRDFIENDSSHFDLVIVEDFFCQMFYAFAHKYQAPLVLLSTFGHAHYIDEYIGNTLELSYVPHEFADSSGEFGRVSTMVYTIYDLIGRRLLSLNHQRELAPKVFKGLKGLPDVAELEANASLILINSHFSLSGVKPTLPNMVDIAGVHIDKVKPLEKGIIHILDSSKNGVVLFSFGSFLDLSKLSSDDVMQWLNAVGALKYDVLLKWTSDEPPPVTFENVHPFKWLPQNDILAHKNLKAFLTHGGLHSTLEAIHHGKPLVCFPFFGDQPRNCKKAETMGYGVQVTKVESNIIIDALNTVLNDDSYSMAAKVLSDRFNDRKLPPMDEAMFHIEYVIRHNGAEFMKSPKRHLLWYQVLYLDVLAMLFIAWKVMSVLRRKLFSVNKRSTKVDKSKKRT